MGDLERLKAMQEAELNKVSISMEDTKIKGAAEKHRGENITVIQNPSPPGSDSRKSNKVVGGIAAGGVVSGLVLAFLWEILLDRSLRRPKEVAERLKLPVFLNIPYMKNGKGRISFLNPGGKVKMLSGGGPGGDAPSGNGAGEAAAVGNGPPALRDENHALRPFHETLRDRLVAYFEMLNLTHKPKLVAVTSCTEGAGVSTIAAGLACSLSETGEGNVLLVDMNDGDGVAHHFYKGKLAMGLDDILEKEKANRKGALMQENLYVVTETNHSDKLPSVLPKRFGHLVSQLKASDYDYILLDMPPVTEISITPRLARFMDTILLVVESEKTDRDAAQRAATLLSEGRTNVGVVINKSRSYVPQRLHHEV
jgi:Mrp family chromosome partitioning ATPase